jgi:flagellar basal-body rod protein FlgB
MTLNDIPLFAMLKGKMAYTNQRQTLIAQNVANADTPGYVPRDMKPMNFDQALKGAQSSSALTAVRTNAGHLQLISNTQLTSNTIAGADPGADGDQASEDSEVRLDGNHVVLEDQMMKLTQAKMDYDAAVGFYQQSMQMLTTAIKKPGS